MCLERGRDRERGRQIERESWSIMLIWVQCSQHRVKESTMLYFMHVFGDRERQRESERQIERGRQRERA